MVLWGLAGLLGFAVWGEVRSNLPHQAQSHAAMPETRPVVTLQEGLTH